ncbi:NAD(P)-dependent oxidoreductase [Devosia insulae DS-56]|uniref:NAD(P)-dependent oxidoreductase n=1 Tax=Devosia insulae DS-56 TaxID=1116389 RepID=A0A1E5XI85_9HYPH|nr:SDR family oxidoreductase [Devosia insulae]OEO28310.1 NAD(P)-dependent oxidoreductase [Devosia insulae DS-56]
MSDKVLVVTGGSRGIGAAVCRLAAARGYGVVVNYAGNVAAAEAVCAEIHSRGGEAVAVRGDVSSAEDVEHIFRAADRLGRLAGLVNNAGTIAPSSRVDAMDAERIARLFAVNVTGSMLCAGAAVRRMSTKHGGAGGGIVNVSSAAAKLGAPGVYVDYAASKGAIDTFTVGLALEVAAEGIRVNGVRPGVIDTDFHATGGVPDRAQQLAPSVPLARAGTAEEVANAILWLLSDDAAYVTGTTLAVTGGRAAAP